MPCRLAQQQMTWSDLHWLFHASRTISVVAELLLYLLPSFMLNGLPLCSTSSMSSKHLVNHSFFSSVVGRTFVASAALPWLGFGPPYCAVSECLPACFQAGGHTSCAPAWMSRCLVSCMWVQSVAGHVVNMVH